MSESKSVLHSKQVLLTQGSSLFSVIRLAQFFASGGTLAAVDPLLLVDVLNIVMMQGATLLRIFDKNKKLYLKKK